jgi:hypothetical protein
MASFRLSSFARLPVIEGYQLAMRENTRFVTSVISDGGRKKKDAGSVLFGWRCRQLGLSA